jgi:hypothetical protein
MTKTVDVAAGQKIASVYGNELRDRTLQVFATVAERDAQWAAAPNGAQCVTLDTGHIWLRQAGVWRLAPGREYAYAEFAGNRPVTATAETTADPLIAAPAVTFPGGAPVIVECFASAVLPAAFAGAIVVLLLYQDGAVAGRLGSVGSPAAGQHLAPAHVVRRLTPTAGSHQYTFAAVQVGGNATVLGGAGTGSGIYMPMFIRITAA